MSSFGDFLGIAPDVLPFGFFTPGVLPAWLTALFMSFIAFISTLVYMRQVFLCLLFR